MLFYQRLILDSVVRRNTDDDRAVAVIAVSRCAGTCSTDFRVEIEEIAESPLGDPVSVSLRGYVLSLRKEELKILKGVRL